MAVIVWHTGAIWGARTYVTLYVSVCVCVCVLVFTCRELAVFTSVHEVVSAGALMEAAWACLLELPQVCGSRDETQNSQPPVSLC